VQKTVDNQDATIEEELSELDMKLRQLRIQYQQFFNGGMKLPPWMLRTEVDRIVRRYANTTMKSFAHRYRFNNIQSKYQSYCELWGRQMRIQEEGTRPSVAARSKPKVQEQLVARARVSDPSADPEALKEIYTRFVEARSQHGQKKGVSFDKFVKGVAGQAAQLRKSSGCGEIELRLVVKDDQVQLKARPGS
jgi:hypothetical protein